MASIFADFPDQITDQAQQPAGQTIQVQGRVDEIQFEVVKITVDSANFGVICTGPAVPAGPSHHAVPDPWAGDQSLR